VPEHFTSFTAFFHQAGLRDLLISTVLFAAIWFAYKRTLQVDLQHLLTKTGVKTDLAYWLTNRLITNPLLIVGATFLFGTLLKFPILLPGLRELHLVVQVLIGSVIYDFFSYWRHRWSHHDLLWPVHAPHHSSTNLNWLSGVREHFLDIILIALFGGILLALLGFSLEAIAIIGIIRLYWIDFVHLDLPFSLGPLDYIITTPRFHRWHHVPRVPDMPGNRNFSGLFSFFDLAFGTFYLPKDKLPERFGAGEPNYPSGFWGQLWQPFRMYAARLKR